MRNLAVSALALMAIATPAFAQDEEAPTFTGPRVEAVLAYDQIGAEGESRTGVAYGGALGYDQQIGNFVVGAEAEATGSTVEQFGIQAGRDLYAGVRAGYALGSTLIYAKGGYTNARVVDEATDEGFNNDGYRVGGGIEHDFGEIYGKIEYRYSRYDDAGLNRDQVLVGFGKRF